MIKLIFKNLWARRRRNIWILIELVLITIVSWVVLDPAIVSGYYFSLDPGYDIDRIVRFDLAELPKSSNGYDPAGEETRIDDIGRLLDKLRADPNVEYATYFGPSIYESGSMNVSSFPDMNTDGCYTVVNFYPGTDFFKTLGIKGLDGKVFEEPPVSGKDIIISRSVADVMHPGINPVGHYLNEKDTVETKWDRDKLIVGVTDETIYRSYMGRSPIVYKYSKLSKLNSAYGVGLMARLKPGMTPEKFITLHGEEVLSKLKSGNVYALSPHSLTEIRDIQASDTRNTYIITVSLAVFFFVNLCLGITGTFYLQTRKRSRDTGIMRSFGATPRYVFTEIMCEGWIMTTLAWVIGCGLYYLYAKDNGLYEATTFWGHSDTIISVLPMWTDFFTTHFCVVSAIIYVALILTVSAGIYFPARRISRANPVDALKDE